MLMFKILFYIILNLILSCASIFIGILFSPLFYFMYLEKYYCYFTYLCVIFLIFYLIKKKRIAYIIFLINFLIFTGIFSYGTYLSFFYGGTLSLMEKLEVIKYFLIFAGIVFYIVYTPFFLIKKSIKDTEQKYENETKNINCVDENNKKNK